MEKEIWKDVIGFEGMYQISNIGRVKSLSRTIKFGRVLITLKERILKPSIKPSGYYKVDLKNKEISKPIPIHQLVAIHFLGEYKQVKGAQVCHKDGNRLNNHASNLYIGDVISNTLDKYKQGRTKLTAKQILEIKASDESTVTLGKKYGVNRSYISFIKTGRSAIHIKHSL